MESGNWARVAGAVLQNQISVQLSSPWQGALLLVSSPPLHAQNQLVRWSAFNLDFKFYC